MLIFHSSLPSLGDMQWSIPGPKRIKIILHDPLPAAATLAPYVTSNSRATLSSATSSNLNGETSSDLQTKSNGIMSVALRIKDIVSDTDAQAHAPMEQAQDDQQIYHAPNLNLSLEPAHSMPIDKIQNPATVAVSKTETASSTTDGRTTVARREESNRESFKLARETFMTATAHPRRTNIRTGHHALSTWTPGKIHHDAVLSYSCDHLRHIRTERGGNFEEFRVVYGARYIVR